MKVRVGHLVIWCLSFKFQNISSLRIEFVGQDFVFCQDFVPKERKEGRKFKSLEVRLQVHGT